MLGEEGRAEYGEKDMAGVLLTCLVGYVDV